MGASPEEGEPCPRCDHPSDPHLLVATTGDALAGGVIICPLRGCDCYATWAVPQAGGSYEKLTIPNALELAELRERLQE